MKLGDAIPPVVPDTAEIVSDGESAAVLREILSGLAAVTQALVNTTTRLGGLVDQHQSATDSLASAARTLAQHTLMPAPEVNLTVPAPEVKVDVAAPPVHVEVREREGREVTEIQRDSDGLIVRTVTEHG